LLSTSSGNSTKNEVIFGQCSQYVYVNKFAVDQPAIFRIHVPDGKIEKVTETPFPTTGVYGNWSGLAPDGSPLLFRSHVQTDVYALSLR
jgi:hypothetical protein